jgi:hypothetical protein
MGPVSQEGWALLSIEADTQEICLGLGKASTPQSGCLYKGEEQANDALNERS